VAGTFGSGNAADFSIFVTFRYIQFFPGSFQDFLDSNFFQRSGKLKPPCSTPDGIDNSRFSELKKDLFQKNGRNLLFLGELAYRYRGILTI
jgi:hypothetical protein